MVHSRAVSRRWRSVVLEFAPAAQAFGRLYDGWRVVAADEPVPALHPRKSRGLIAHRHIHTALAGEILRLLVTSVGMSNDAHPRITREDPAKPSIGHIGAVRHANHARVLRKSDSNASAIVQ